jgi:hypothetical protein
LFTHLHLSFWLSHQYPICIPLLPHSCYMPCPSHPPWLDHFYYTWRRVQFMKLYSSLLKKIIINIYNTISIWAFILYHKLL